MQPTAFVFCLMYAGSSLFLVVVKCFSFVITYILPPSSESIVRGVGCFDRCSSFSRLCHHFLPPHFFLTQPLAYQAAPGLPQSSGNPLAVVKMAEVEVDIRHLRQVSLDSKEMQTLLSPGPKSPRVLHPPPTDAMPSVRSLIEQKALVERVDQVGR